MWDDEDYEFQINELTERDIWKHAVFISGFQRNQSTDLTWKEVNNIVRDLCRYLLKPQLSE